jgi:hypothetical protein
MNKNIMFLAMFSVLAGCGGGGGGGGDDDSSGNAVGNTLNNTLYNAITSAIVLPSQGIGVDSSDPVGIWVGVGNIKYSSVLENADFDNRQNIDEYNQNYEQTSVQKLYFAIRRNDETGQIVAPCDGFGAFGDFGDGDVGELVDDGNGKLVFNDSNSFSGSSVSRSGKNYTSIEISENGRMTLQVNSEFSENGTADDIKDYKYNTEKETAFTAVKISDSTSFLDLYQFSFRTTDGVDSFTDDAVAGDKDLLCALIGTGITNGTINKEPYNNRIDSVGLKYKNSQVFISRLQGTKNELILYSDLDEVIYNPVANCDEIDCDPRIDVQASKDALILSSTNENIITELTIKTSK